MMGRSQALIFFLSVAKHIFGADRAKVTLADADLRVLVLSHMCVADFPHVHVKSGFTPKNKTITGHLMIA